eukprot:INCI12543.2.p1 GENE.INCI12543.2~~INCI12543.2.p1  ORF type:complete len:357 (+),score=49.32 INCI12543.2:119-1189(+)
MTEQLPISVAHQHEETPKVASTATASAQSEIPPPLPQSRSSSTAAMSQRSLAQAAVTAVLGFSSFSPRFRALSECDKHHVVIAIQRYFRNVVAQPLARRTHRQQNIFFENRWKYYSRELAHLHAHHHGTAGCHHGAAEDGPRESDSNATLNLASKQWLECVDLHHRYGAHLRQFFNVFVEDTETNISNFFYWLDFGDGKHVQRAGSCSREDLEKGRVEYCDAAARARYEVAIKDGILTWKNRGDGSERLQCPDAVKVPKSERTVGMPSKWIFVADVDDTLYVGQKRLCNFHHSSFFAGAPVKLAGGLVVRDGQLVVLSPHSGHYRPTQAIFEAFLSSLSKRGVDMSTVTIASFDKT